MHIYLKSNSYLHHHLETGVSSSLLGNRYRTRLKDCRLRIRQLPPPQYSSPGARTPSQPPSTAPSVHAINSFSCTMLQLNSTVLKGKALSMYCKISQMLPHISRLFVALLTRSISYVVADRAADKTGYQCPRTPVVGQLRMQMVCLWTLSPKYPHPHISVNDVSVKKLNGIVRKCHYRILQSNEI